MSTHYNGGDEIEFNSDPNNDEHSKSHTHHGTISNIDETKNDKITSFIWRIPSLTKQQRDLLCTGYIHAVTNQYIPNDIIKLCMIYIDDSYLISAVQDAENGQGFKSNFFSIGKYKFFCDIYPNGYGVEAEGNVDIFLNLASLSPVIPKIEVSYCFVIKEFKQDLDDTFRDASFSDNDISSCISRLTHNDIIDINTMTFILKIKKLTVYHEIIDEKQNEQDIDIKNDDDIKECHSIEINNDLGLYPNGYIWTLNTISGGIADGEYYQSDMFIIDTFKFMLKIYKTIDGEYDLCLCLASLSPKIERLCLYYRMFLCEAGIENDGSIAFATKSLHWWPQRFLTKKHMINYKILTIKLEITIIEAFDITGNNILNYKALQNDKLIIRSSKYEWIITNGEEEKDGLLDSMKTAKYGTHFNSDCFELNGLKWFIQFFPGGYNAESERSSDLFLYLVSIPPNISYIAMNYSMSLKEKNTKFTYSEQFSKENFLTGWPSNALTQQQIQDVNKLTFIININVIDVYDINGIAVTDRYFNDKSDELYIGKSIELPSKRYLWRITDKETLNKISNVNLRKCFQSKYFEMYSFKWYLQFYNLNKYPNDDEKEEEKEEKTVQLFICLVSLPSNISRISFQYELILQELNIIHSHFEQFTENDTTIGWSNIKKPKLKDIIKLNKLTFEVRVNLIDIYDKQSKNITNKYKYIDDDDDNKDNSMYNIMAKEIDIPQHEHIWNISDEQIVERLKNAENGAIYRSKLFMIESFVFFCQICPNGSNPKRDGSFNWYIYWASIPPKISKMAFSYKLQLYDTDSTDIDCKELRVKSSSWGWGNDILKFKQIQNLKKLIFKLEISIVDIFKHNGDIINRNQYKTLIPKPSLKYVLMDEYEWKIENKTLLENIRSAINGQCFYSQIFGNTDIKWKLQFFPNGSEKKFKNEAILCINLIKLPLNVSGISIYFELYVIETRTRWTHCSHFRSDHLCQGWETARVKFTKIKTLNILTLKAKVYLIDVYDNDSNIITQKYFDSLQHDHVTVDDEYLV